MSRPVTAATLDREPRVPWVGAAAGMPSAPGRLEIEAGRLPGQRLLSLMQSNGPLLDPLGESGNRGVWEFALRRHPQDVVVVFDRLDQQTGLDITRHDRRTRIAPEAHPIEAVEPQAPLERLRLRGMALEAMLRQHRPHLRLEKILTIGSPIGLAPGAGQPAQKKQQ